MAGPHDGAVADWGGGKFHVEFTVDHDKQEGTVYILAADEKTPTPIAAQEIQLSKREFSLLHYLALRHGQVVTRIEIEDHLYNEHTLPSSNAVDSAICTLRRKLDDAGCTEVIHTKRGAGYMMQRVES